MFVVAFVPKVGPYKPYIFRALLSTEYASTNILKLVVHPHPPSTTMSKEKHISANLEEEMRKNTNLYSPPNPKMKKKKHMSRIGLKI